MKGLPFELMKVLFFYFIFFIIIFNYFFVFNVLGDEIDQKLLFEILVFWAKKNIEVCEKIFFLAYYENYKDVD